MASKSKLESGSLYRLSGKNRLQPTYVAIPYDTTGNWNLHAKGALVFALMAEYLGQDPGKFSSEFDSIELVTITDCHVLRKAKVTS